MMFLVVSKPSNLVIVVLCLFKNKVWDVLHRCPIRLP